MDASSQLRFINGLLREIDIISVECSGEKGKAKNTKLDHFQQTKLDLNDMLKVLKADIKTQKGIEERVGTNSESIKLKHKIAKNLNDAKQMATELEAAYEQEQKDYDNGVSDVKDIKERQELVQLMRQDLEYTENEFDNKNDKSSGGGGGFQLARQARANRKKKRDQGLMASEPQPLTSKQQAFIQETIERDQVLDEKLDQIKAGVMQLNAIGHDINEEFDRQAVMLQEVEQKMDKVTEKLESRNEQMKQLLDAQGGGTRWGCVLLLIIVFLACCGYIYNQFLMDN